MISSAAHRASHEGELMYQQAHQIFAPCRAAECGDGHLGRATGAGVPGGASKRALMVQRLYWHPSRDCGPSCCTAVRQVLAYALAK